MKTDSNMKKVHHFLSEFLGIRIFMRQQIVQGIGIEKGGDGDKAVVFSEIAPKEQLMIEHFDVSFAGRMFFQDAAQLEIRFAVGMDFFDERGILQILDIGLNQSYRFRGAAHGMPHFPEEEQNEQA